MDKYTNIEKNDVFTNVRIDNQKMSVKNSWHHLIICWASNKKIEFSLPVLSLSSNMNNQIIFEYIIVVVHEDLPLTDRQVCSVH